MKKKVRAGGAKLGPIMQITLICLAAYVALLGLLFSGVTPQQYDIQVGAPAPIQILATKDVLDTVTTDALREAAAAAVEPSYKSADPNVVTEVMQDLNAEFDRLRELRAGLQSVDLDALSEVGIAELTPWSDFALSRDQLRAVQQADDAAFEAALTDIVNEVHDMLASTLPEGQEDAAVRSLRAELEKTYGATLAEALSGLVRRCIQPTMLIDETITEENRNKAREAVEPEMCVKGEVIVREGDIVTPAQYTMISSLGLLSENSFDVQLFAGVAMLVLLAMATMGFYLWRFHRRLLTSPKQMLLLCVIVVLTAAICTGLREIHVYLTPVTLGLLLVALLVDVRLALFVNTVLALLAGALISAGSTSYAVMLMTVACGPMIAVLFSRSMLRTTTLLAGLCIAVSNFFVTLAVGLFSSAEMQGVLVNALWAAGGGALSAVLCIGIQPLLEWLFNLAPAAKASAGGLGHLSPFHHRGQSGRGGLHGHRRQRPAGPCRRVLSRHRQAQAAHVLQGKSDGGQSPRPHRSPRLGGHSDRSHPRRRADGSEGAHSAAGDRHHPPASRRHTDDLLLRQGEKALRRFHRHLRLPL